jgi:hypothetical protein
MRLGRLVKLATMNVRYRLMQSRSFATLLTILGGHRQTEPSLLLVFLRLIFRVFYETRPASLLEAIKSQLPKRSEPAFSRLPHDPSSLYSGVYRMLVDSGRLAWSMHLGSLWPRPWTYTSIALAPRSNTESTSAGHSDEKNCAEHDGRLYTTLSPGQGFDGHGVACTLAASVLTRSPLNIVDAVAASSASALSNA